MKADEEIMADEDELAGCINPDPFDLDSECAKQPGLRKKYGDMLADAKKELAQAKAFRLLIEDSLGLKIKQDPASYGATKATEATVTSLVRQQPEWDEANCKVIDCQHEVDTLDSAVTSIDHRKRMLSDLTTLWMGKYYSNVDGPKGTQSDLSYFRRGRQLTNKENDDDV